MQYFLDIEISRIEIKIENIPGEDQFGFRRGKGTTDRTGMLRMISERTMGMNKELCKLANKLLSFYGTGRMSYLEPDQNVPTPLIEDPF